MPKNEEYLHHQPRVIDKKKRVKVPDADAVLENRGNRVNFKNYLRQIKEQETLDASTQQEWGIKRVVFLEEDAPDEDILMDVFPTEEEAEWAAFKLNESELDDDVSYEAFKM